jgi:anti-sigma-K factor RskA
MSIINKNEADQRLDQLAFGYECKSLNGEDLKLVEQELIQLAEFQTRLAYWHQYNAELDYALNPVSAPAEVWHNINKQIQMPTGSHKVFNVPQASGVNKWCLGWREISWAAAASIILVMLVLFTGQPARQFNNPVYLDNQWMVQSNTNNNIITLVAISPAPMPTGTTCNLWITNDSGTLFVAELPVQGEVVVNLSNQPDVLRKLQQPGILQVTLDPKGSQPTVMGTPMVEASWSI